MLRRLPALLPLLFGVWSSSFAQCAMCGSAAASSPGVSRGLAYSIFFLLGMLALVVAWLVLLVRRAQSRSRETIPGAERSVETAIPAPGAPTGHAPAEN